MRVSRETRSYLFYFCMTVFSETWAKLCGIHVFWGMKTWKPMVVFIKTGGFWRCSRPSALNIAKTPSFNETTIGFKFSTPRTRETAKFRPSFTETVIQKKNERFPLKTWHLILKTIRILVKTLMICIGSCIHYLCNIKV